MFHRILCLLVVAFSPLVLSQALQPGQVFDQLVAAGVSPSDAVANAIAETPSAAPNIANHAIKSHPKSLVAIVFAAIKASPNQVIEIASAAIDAAPDKAKLIMAVATQAAPKSAFDLLEMAMNRTETPRNKTLIAWAKSQRSAQAKMQSDLNPSASEAARIAAKQQSESSTSSHVDDITERNFRRSASPN